VAELYTEGTAFKPPRNMSAHLSYTPRQSTIGISWYRKIFTRLDEFINDTKLQVGGAKQYLNEKYGDGRAKDAGSEVANADEFDYQIKDDGNFTVEGSGDSEVKQ